MVFLAAFGTAGLLPQTRLTSLACGAGTRKTANP